MDVKVRTVAPLRSRRAALAGAAPAGVLAVAAALGAGACARQQTKPPVELSWYSWGPQFPPQWTLGPGLNPRMQGFFGGAGQPTPVPPEKVLEQQIAGFLAEQPNLKVAVQTERFDRYHDKLRAFAAAGKMPDVVAYDGPMATTLIRANVLYNLSRLQGAKVRSFLQDFPTSYLEASAYRGKLFGVPYQSRQLVLYVNKSLFGGLSLPPPEWGNPNWTWVHFLEKASALTHRAFGGGYRQFGTLVTGRPMWAAAVRQNGGREFNREMSRSAYDAPEVYEAIQWTSDLMHRYRVAPTERQNPRGASWTFDFGNVAMWIWYQHSIPLVHQRVLNFEWDVYPLPSSKRSATYADWGYLSISQNVRDVDKAWDLVRFLSGPDGDALALREGVAGPIVRGTEPGYLTGSGSAKNKAAAIQAAHQPAATRPHHESWAQIESLLEFYLRPVWSGDQRAVYACREMRVVIDGVLAGLETPKAPAIGNESGEGGGD